jgi:hypothetical protein
MSAGWSHRNADGSRRLSAVERERETMWKSGTSRVDGAEGGESRLQVVKHSAVVHGFYSRRSLFF